MLTRQIPAFAETSVDQSRKIRIGLDQNRAGLESLFNAVNQQTHIFQKQREREVSAGASSSSAPPEYRVPPQVGEEEVADEEMPGVVGRPATPRNPKLPPYDGGQDPALWLHQCNACFIANQTPVDQQGPWMITVLRGKASRYFFQECGSKNSGSSFFADRMKVTHIFFFH